MDKNGDEFKSVQGSWYRNFQNQKGEDVEKDIDSRGGSLDSVLINCEKLNCNNKFRFLLKKMKMGRTNMSMKSERLTLKL